MWLDACSAVGLDNDEIFVVSCLNDRYFNLGFRIVNPEFNATPDRIRSDEESLNELIEYFDHSDPANYHNFQQPNHLSKKERTILKEQNGELR